MERKKKYTAPAVLEEFHLETEVRILAASHVNEPIEEDVEVVSMGQELGNDNNNWNFTWEN